MYIIKRDGRKVPFDKNKIVNAIDKAYRQFNQPSEGVSEEIADLIEIVIREQDDTPTVEDIQDLVEHRLMTHSPEIAKGYILYREERSKERNRKSALMQAMKRRLNATAVENANANVDEHSFSGREKEASADIQKIYALEQVFSAEVARAHKEMLLYQHDMEKTAIGEHNCLNIDFEKLFNEGFATRNGDIRPPATFSTACQQMAVIFQCQSQVQFGGVGTVHIDYDLAPFVKTSFAKHFLDGFEWLVNGGREVYNENELRKLSINDSLYDEHPRVKEYAMAMLRREMKQSAEALYHNLNTLESRAGSQVPFTSINYGRDESPEGKLVSEAMLNASLAGIGKNHLTSIFPISIFQYKVGCNANKHDPNYSLKELALESLSRRIYPNFCNCDWSQANEKAGDPDTYFSTMGKRKLQLM